MAKPFRAIAEKMEHRYGALVLGASGLLLALALISTACNGGQAGKPDQARIETANAPAADSGGQDGAARGKYLVSALGCHDCHTPLKMGPNGPQPDMSQALTGHPAALSMPPAPKLQEPWMWAGAATNTAFAGPWGVSYAINLTPDDDTGIGLWSEQVFVNALKTGRHMGVGRQIMPPMPWPSYSHLTDADLKAMYAYLRTLEPRKNQVPDAVVSAPPAGAPASTQ